MLFAVAALALVVMVVLPVGWLVVTSFSGPHGATLENYATTGTGAAALACAKAAADAVEAAILARNGFTAAPASLEGRRGLAALMASNFDAACLTRYLH